MGNVLHNCRSLGKVTVKTESGNCEFSVNNGNAVFFFSLNELTEELWNRQCGQKTLCARVAAARPEDVVALVELIVGILGINFTIERYAGLEMSNWDRVKHRITNFSARELRLLNSVL